LHVALGGLDLLRRGHRPRVPPDGSLNRRTALPVFAEPVAATCDLGSSARYERGGRSRMKAVVFAGVGDIRLEDVPDPTMRAPTDAIVRLTASAICGTDLHFIRGTMPGTGEGRIL